MEEMIDSFCFSEFILLSLRLHFLYTQSLPATKMWMNVVYSDILSLPVESEHYGFLPSLIHFPLTLSPGDTHYEKCHSNVSVNHPHNTNLNGI